VDVITSLTAKEEGQWFITTSDKRSRVGFLAFHDVLYLASAMPVQQTIITTHYFQASYGLLSLLKNKWICPESAVSEYDM
jgi:hypothetical protein